ncbi:MAG: AzlD domain-containing protein [Acidimicrobiia bacterium]|nr:AzlD domain-containing protein [Acidimicrobiia bacterium]MDH3470650.1 AzlD domain-containing protein [Acidimicrobiia bacterium]
MSDLSIVIAMAVITYSSRVVFLVRPRTLPGGAVGRFLDVFPVALFVALATIGLGAPDGDPDVTIALAAAGGGLIGAVVTKRSLPGVVIFGGAAWWLARTLT